MRQHVEAAFDSFERQAARVKPSDLKASKELHPQIRSVLERDLPGVVETFLSGSYARRTHAVVLKDVDIIVVLEDPDGAFHRSANAAMTAIKQVAVGCDIVRRTLKRVRAVKLFVHDHDLTVDVVAGLRPDFGDGLLIPRRLPAEGYDDWTLAHPRAQLAAARQKNADLQGLYVPVVRIARFWNILVGKPLRSYHVEALVWHSVSDDIGGYEAAAVAFFEGAYDLLAPGRRVSDPGNPSANVDDRLDGEDRRKAKAKIDRARDLAWAAADADDETACDAWAKVFGSAFPAPTTDEDNVAGALSEQSAAASRAGLVAGTGRPIIKPRSWRPNA